MWAPKPVVFESEPYNVGIDDDSGVDCVAGVVGSCAVLVEPRGKKGRPWNSAKTPTMRAPWTWLTGFSKIWEFRIEFFGDWKRHGGYRV